MSPLFANEEKMANNERIFGKFLKPGVKNALCRVIV